MASTNTTANYGLPQYISTDKPTYLGDFNNAMISIDTAIKGVSDIATANQGNISQAQTDITEHESRLGVVEAETTVNTSDISTANQNIINLQSQTNTQGQQIATITQTTNANTLVIGSGQLETEAQTIIPAINELNSNIITLGQAEIIGMTSTGEQNFSYNVNKYKGYLLEMLTENAVLANTYIPRNMLDFGGDYYLPITAQDGTYYYVHAVFSSGSVKLSTTSSGFPCRLIGLY